MNQYVEFRMEHFGQYFNGLLQEQQNRMIRAYMGNIVKDILVVKSRREYCEILAGFLVESGKVKIGIYTFEELVDVMVEFFEQRKVQIYPSWQKKLLSWFEMKMRINGISID